MIFWVNLLSRAKFRVGKEMMIKKKIGHGIRFHGQ